MQHLGTHSLCWPGVVLQDTLCRGLWALVLVRMGPLFHSLLNLHDQSCLNLSPTELPESTLLHCSSRWVLPALISDQEMPVAALSTLGSGELEQQPRSC